MNSFGCVSYSAAVGWQLKLQVLVRHLDDTEGGCGSNHVGTILVLRLETKTNSHV